MELSRVLRRAAVPVVSEVLFPRLELREIERTILRRFNAPRSSSLLTLHDNLQSIAGWTNSHLLKVIAGDRDCSECLPDAVSVGRKDHNDASP